MRAWAVAKSCWLQFGRISKDLCEASPQARNRRQATAFGGTLAAAATAIWASTQRGSTPRCDTGSGDHESLTHRAQAHAATELFGRAGNPVATMPEGVTYLLLVRHGETLWNADGRTQGQLNISLNDAGRSQARRLGETLKHLGVAEHVDAIVSSDLSRASETAELLAEALPGARLVPPTQNAAMSRDLREFHFGDVQGMLHEESKSAKKQVYDAWKEGQFDLAFPGQGGETATAAIERGLRAFGEAAQLGSFVVVIAHGGLIKWCAIATELGAEGPNPHSMKDPRIKELLRAKVGNCYCSALLWDRNAGRPVQGSGRWFRQVDVSDSKDDTG